MPSFLCGQARPWAGRAVYSIRTAALPGLLCEGLHWRQSPVILLGRVCVLLSHPARSQDWWPCLWLGQSYWLAPPPSRSAPAGIKEASVCLKDHLLQAGLEAKRMSLLPPPGSLEQDDKNQIGKQSKCIHSERGSSAWGSALRVELPVLTQKL